MFVETEPTSDARRLTDQLRASSEHSPPYAKNGAVNERDNLLQIVLTGGVLRQRVMSSGRVHTVAVYFSDDVINLCRYATGRGGETEYLQALQGAVIGSVPYYAVRNVEADTRGRRDGMSSLMAREVGIAHERMVSLGQRNAVEAMAHFFCEMVIRNGALLLETNKCAFQLTQDTLSTILGITPGHVNRTLRSLRLAKIATVEDHQLIVYNPRRLAVLADFDESYLSAI